MVPPQGRGHPPTNAAQGVLSTCRPSRKSGRAQGSSRAPAWLPSTPGASPGPWSQLGSKRKSRAHRAQGLNNHSRTVCPLVSLAQRANWKNPTTPTAVPHGPQLGAGSRTKEKETGASRCTGGGSSTPAVTEEEETGASPPEEMVNGSGQGSRLGYRLAGARGTCWGEQETQPQRC